MYKIRNTGHPLVKPETYGGQHPKDHHHSLSGIIIVVGPFHYHQLILLEWCQDMEQGHMQIQMDTLNGKPEHHHYQWHDD